MSESCPCGSGKPYADCCGPVLQRECPATTAEALMRSRYTAFTRNDMDYLRRSLVASKRATFNGPKTQAWNADVAWTGLRILATQDGGEADTKGIVEFEASFVKNGEPGSIHETSRFKKKGPDWFYVDGRPGGMEAPATTATTQPKVGRNAPCPCGSGKKFKHCCGS